MSAPSRPRTSSPLDHLGEEATGLETTGLLDVHGAGQPLLAKDLDSEHVGFRADQGDDSNPHLPSLVDDVPQAFLVRLVASIAAFQ